MAQTARIAAAKAAPHPKMSHETQPRRAGPADFSFFDMVRKPPSATTGSGAP